MEIGLTVGDVRHLGFSKTGNFNGLYGLQGQLRHRATFHRNGQVVGVGVLWACQIAEVWRFNGFQDGGCGIFKRSNSQPADRRESARVRRDRRGVGARRRERLPPSGTSLGRVRASPTDTELGHWVTGSMGHLSRPGHHFDPV